MKTPVLTLVLTGAALLFAMPVWAHPGHLAEVAGHGHWLGAAAIGAAIALGALAALKGKKKDATDQAQAEDDQELEEAAA